jgi:hypothetical protein
MKQIVIRILENENKNFQINFDNLTREDSTTDEILISKIIEDNFRKNLSEIKFNKKTLFKEMQKLGE